MVRVIIIIIISVHGALHLLGFVKGFGLSEVKGLSEPVSKTFGVLWLLAFILFVSTGILLAFRNSYWWMIGLISVIVSQALIIYFWQDAKFGTIANLIILIAIIIGYGTWSYYRQYQRDVEEGLNRLKQESYFPDSILTETDIKNLPEPVRRYIRYTQSIGKPKVNNFKIEFTGKIRKDDKSEWMSFTSEQNNFMPIPTRLFFMKAVMKSFPVTGYHIFKNGDAKMDIRLLSLFRVQFLDGDEMNMAETVTFFNDMCCMAPATLIDERIKWLESEGNKVKASFTNNGITINAILYFDGDGKLENFISNDRYDYEAGGKLPWSTPLTDYKELNGYRLAGFAEAVYSYPGGDLCYATFVLKSISYNSKTIL